MVALYNRLYISGNVTNTGIGIAYNAGLHVVAYDNGVLEVNMTVPLANGATFGTDNATIASALSTYGSVSSLQLGNLGSGQTATIGIGIIHEGYVTNWAVTPVCWTYSP